MNRAGFFFAMSTTCAYFAVMRGSARPRKSCTARRSPVCRYPKVPAVRKAWFEMPGGLRPASRRCLSVCTRIWRRLKRLPPLWLPTAENKGVPVPSRSTLPRRARYSFNPEAARRGGYTPGSFRVLAHQFRQEPGRQFFLPPAKGPKTAPKTDRLRDKVIALRKQNLSIYDISQTLSREAEPFSPVAVSLILKEEGFARLPRRQDEERPAATRPTAAAVANVAELDLSPRKFRTRFGGLFLFLPALAPADLDCILQPAGFPGSQMVPAPHAVRSLLGLKLFGAARHSHVMSHVFDPRNGSWRAAKHIKSCSRKYLYRKQFSPDG